MTHPPDEDAADPLIGRIVDRRFRVDARVGRGAHGTVYRARHLMLDAPVAIKILAGHDSRRLARFAREARVLLALKHPHIASALDMGELVIAPGERPRAYLVMDWCEGEMLGVHLARRGRLSLEDAVEIAEPLADALAHAHGLGIVHCDVKPANVLVAREGERNVPRLVDFGVAIRREPGESSDPDEGDAFTPAYAAPEQIVGAAAGPFTDVHALGLLLVEMLTGQPPYDRGRELEQGADPERPSPRARGVDAGPLEAVIARALSQRPAERYADGAALRDAIRDAASALPDREARGRAAKSRARAVIAIATVLVVATGATIGSLVTRRDRQRGGAREGASAIAPSEAEVSPPPCAWPAEVLEKRLEQRGFVMVGWSRFKDASVGVVVEDAAGTLLAIDMLEQAGDVESATSAGRVRLAQEAASLALAPSLGVGYAMSPECLLVTKGPRADLEALFMAVRADTAWTIEGWAPDGPDPLDAFRAPRPASDRSAPVSFVALSEQELVSRVEQAGAQVYDVRLTPSRYGRSFEVFFVRDGERGMARLEHGPYARVVLQRALEADGPFVQYAIEDETALMITNVQDPTFADALVAGLGISMTRVPESKALQ